MGSVLQNFQAKQHPSRFHLTLFTMPITITEKNKWDGFTDETIDFLIKVIGDLIVSEKWNTTKFRQAKYIHQAIKGKYNGSWNVIVASTLECGEEGDDDFRETNASLVLQKYLKLQLSDDLYCQIWKSKDK